MKITYLKWGYSYEDAIIRAFENEGIRLEIISSSDCSLTNNANREKANEDNSDLKKLLETCTGDIIFTINFLAQSQILWDLGFRS